MKLILVLALGLFVYTNILVAQTPRGTTKHCYGQPCPQNTTFCLKIVNTTANDENIVTEVDCLDSNFTVTARFNHSKINIFSPVLSFEGVSISSVSEIPPLSPANASGN